MMGSGSIKEFFQKVLDKDPGRSAGLISHSPVSGGCIHHAIRLDTDQGPFFIKYNKAGDADMFVKEARGLELLKQANALKIPTPLDAGAMDGYAYILTEFIEPGPGGAAFFQRFGRQLANLHHHRIEQYGLDHNNYIGRLPQENDPMEDWIGFFTERRLEVQVRMALDNGLMDRSYIDRFQRLYHALPDLLPVEPPSLLHGDLWGGNYMIDALGEAVLIDPAVYYGHREIELSFTKMFGGFDPDFYQSYDEAYPLQPGFDQRVEIYNLYPTLVHLNLFGRSYITGIDHVLSRYA